MKSNYEGLWKSSSGWYVSAPFKKKDWNEMPKSFRIILKQNRYWKKNDDGSKRPRFIFSFVDGKTANNLKQIDFEQNSFYAVTVLVEKETGMIYTLDEEPLNYCETGYTAEVGDFL